MHMCISKAGTKAPPRFKKVELKKIRFHVPEKYKCSQQFKSTFTQDTGNNSIELQVFIETPIDYLDRMPESLAILKDLAMSEAMQRLNSSQD